MHHGCFSGSKNKERYNLECSHCVPEWFEWISSVQLCLQFIPPFRTKQSSKEAIVLYSALPPCCEMMCCVIEVTLPGLT